ncbi:hypothetical protein [Saccharopolyspora rectivirgula]|uniref:hypothetical protein n=1 Tax=Saccharopolyspora rectivirgula TaxID=28042 RepID=UPI0004A3FE50|nr:hypothetical protein [Saccharopolyspora rectivirgula]
MTEAQPVVLDVGNKAARAVLLGGAVSGAIGLFTYYACLTDQISGGTGTLIVAWIIGSVFFGIGLLCAFGWRAASRPRKLIFEAAGIRWDDPKGKPWAVRWEELGGVAVSRTKERAVQASDHLTRRTMVRLDLFPADPGFRQRHPEMEHLWEFHRVKNGYRLPLGDAAEFIPLIEQGMHQFRPQLYLGVRDEGFTVGLT